MAFVVTGIKQRSWRGYVMAIGIGLSSFYWFVVYGQQQRTRPVNAPPKAAQQTNDATSALTEAANLLKAGKLEEAEALTRRVVSGAPGNPNAHILLGVILDQRGREVEAEREYREALRLQPNNVSALANLGVLLAHTKRLDQAIETFELVVKIQPTQPQAVFNLGTLYAARGDYGRAITLLERASGWPDQKMGSATPDVPLLLSLV